MKEIFIIALLAGFCAKLSAKKRGLAYASLPKELSGRIILIKLNDGRSQSLDFELDAHFDLDLNLGYLRLSGFHASYKFYLDFNKTKWYLVLDNGCLMGSNGVPSLADIQTGPGFYEFHEVAQPGKLGSDGAIVEMYSANFEGEYVLLTMETIGEKKIPVTVAVKASEDTLIASFLDLKTSVTPVVWSIPQNCQEMTSAGGGGLPHGMLHAARLHQVMRKGFPWTGGLTTKRGFPWTGGLTNKRGFPWTGGLTNKRGFPWTGGLTHKRGKKIRNLAEFNVNDQQNEESE
ncbi:uncharacterized protein [Acropora muricata]|uniref:uncharacterized protein n=1 Tax=Acropora muricata TaxID=159855 RepID=UPI0034E472DE